MFSPGLLIRFAPALLGGLAISCASSYWQNRARDAGDVFTAEVNSRSYGAQLRVGPVQLGASYKDADGYSGGLRGGTIGRYHSAGFTALFFGADYISAKPIQFEEASEEAEAEEIEADDSEADSADKAETEGETETEDDAEIDEDTQSSETSAASILELRQKTYRARLPLGSETPTHRERSLLKSEDNKLAPASFFTQIEFGVGAYFGFRLGFNPGELLDLLLGFAGIDLMDDDAPYSDSLEEQLRASPYWRQLDAATQRQLLERLRRGEGLPAGN